MAISSIVLGALKLLSALSMLGMSKILATEARLLDRLPTSPVTSLQRELFERMSALTTAFVADHRVLLVVASLLGATLVAGGIGCLKLLPSFRTASLVGLLGLVACEAALAPAEIHHQLVVADMTVANMAKMEELTRPANKNLGTTLSSLSRTTAKASLVTAVAWIVVRVLACGGSFVYLASAPVKRLFEGELESRLRET